MLNLTYFSAILFHVCENMTPSHVEATLIQHLFQETKSTAKRHQNTWCSKHLQNFIPCNFRLSATGGRAHV